jgi:DNA-binding beta-propeller fold protein YncE
VYVTRDSSVFVIDTARHAVFGSRIDIGHRVNALAVSPDGLRVYVTSAGGVSVINKGSQVAPEPSILDGDGADAMAVSPDSGRLYVATGSGVSVIDTKRTTLSGRSNSTPPARWRSAPTAAASTPPVTRGVCR